MPTKLLSIELQNWFNSQLVYFSCRDTPMRTYLHGIPSCESCSILKKEVIEGRDRSHHAYIQIVWIVMAEIGIYDVNISVQPREDVY